MTQADWNDIQQAIADLPVKKVLKLKVNGTKVKVKHNVDGSYGTYLNGQWITDDDDPKTAYDLVKNLIVTI